MSLTDTGPEFVTQTPPCPPPVPVAFSIVPPDPALPVPSTVRPPPAVPVPLISTPSTGPPPGVPAELDCRVSPPAPIRVPAPTASAVAVVVLSVLVAFVALTVPPPVAANAGLAWVALARIGPVKLMVAPLSPATSTPLPWSVPVPLTVTTPPERFCTVTEWPLVLVIWAPIDAAPLPPLTSRPSPVLLVSETVGSRVKELMPVALIPAPALSPTVTLRTTSPSASDTPGPPVFVITGFTREGWSSVSDATVSPAGCPASVSFAPKVTPPPYLVAEEK